MEHTVTGKFPVPYTRSSVASLREAIEAATVIFITSVREAIAAATVIFIASLRESKVLLFNG